MKASKVAWAILLYVWQLPQNLFGLLFLLYFRKEKEVADLYGRKIYVAPTMSGGISLGRYIVLSPDLRWNVAVYYHELGHSRQSVILGALYLIVIGLPSLLHARTCRAENYYHFWTESWANRLGGIPGYRG